MNIIAKTTGCIIGTYFGFIISQASMKSIFTSLQRHNMVPQILEPLVIITVIGTITLGTCAGGFYGFVLSQFVHIPALK